jgi:predicted metalloprotease
MWIAQALNMEWTPGGMSGDIEDRRGEGSGGGNFGGFGGMHIGIGGALLLGILSLVFHQNLFTLFSGTSDPSAAVATNSAPQTEQTQFVSFVIDDVQRTWDQILPQQTGKSYRHAKLVLYEDETPSACGEAQTATGPFYCPGDEKVYLDLGFFRELGQRFGAPGEFAQAYVIAHEIGHHVQKILGIEQQVRTLQQRDRGDVNRLSVGLELQADCFAGVWGHSTEQRKIINDTDVEAGLRAAAAVGDDRLQRMAGRHVTPESFTHGSSAQRTDAFRSGLQSGSVQACRQSGPSGE